ncbi:inositol monophosphatase family protein [Celeribacter sp.]|uniref:inositol monophosphatase family protein n=1 Tax=Celeribacter sp. TaxID=1890673 RepID=UPI003A9064F9
MPEADDLSLLISAAREAGEIAKRFFRKDPQVWDKGGDDGPVTEADFAVDSYLSESLTRARPDYGWLSEETADTPARLERTRCFIVDPIDGTRSFIHGDKNWAHSLAVVEDGQPVAAVVYLPMRDRLFTAAKGKGAFLNDDPIKVGDHAQPDGARVLTARPNLAATHWIGTCPEFVHKFRPSLAYRLSLVAQGRYDAMISLRNTWEWDVAAGTLIVTEAGGTVTDRIGNAPEFNRPRPAIDGMIAANPRLTREILDRLRPL